VADTLSPPAISISRDVGARRRLRRRTIVITFAAIILISFLLRIFYAGYLYEDDGLWFAAAEEMLGGKALYRDIYFDKPPGSVLVYAALFKLFGAHILTIRIFTIVYSVAVSAALFVFGRRLYGEREGLTTAIMFAVFSTIYTTGHVQALNTDFLMALPYTMAAYWLLRASDDVFGRHITVRQSAGFALAGGACVAVAMQFNPKGAFALIFFGLFLLLAFRWQRGDRAIRRRGDAVRDANKGEASLSLRVAAPPLHSVAASLHLRVRILSLVGLAVGTLPFIVWLTATHALKLYWLYVWDWGARYARYYPTTYVIANAVGQTVNYFLLNNTLLITLIFVALTVYKRRKQSATTDVKSAVESEAMSEAAFRADITLLLWLAVSFIGMSVGGRFYGHYFFQILPALCLIGGRGLTRILASLTDREQGSQSAERGAGATRISRWRAWQRVVMALVVIGFAVTMVRFHTRTALLAADWWRGAPSDSPDVWYHERLKDEERQVAATVRNLEMEPSVASRQLGVEAMRRGGPRERAPASPSDYLFVWGYRPEIYYWSGLLPASKYLSTQPLTGVPGDAHYHSVHYHAILDERDTAAARRELAEELTRTQPEYIVDELGFFNDNLAMARYSEFDEILSRYKRTGTVKRFIIYRRRDLIKAGKRDKQTEQDRENGIKEEGATGK
jgi:4-amino-4-deoxy-L-arabinose transferase-like glycosyltransferase